MANQNTIKSYVILRNDTAERWSNSTIILKKGEVALSLENNVYSIKVGNGIDTWSNLPYVEANSKDVSQWAKSETKPTYTADEISNFTETVKAAFDDIGLATEEQHGLLDKSDKYKLNRYTVEDIEKWKSGYNRLKIIEQKIQNINFSTNDISTTLDISLALEAIIQAFKSDE